MENKDIKLSSEEKKRLDKIIPLGVHAALQRKDLDKQAADFQREAQFMFGFDRAQPGATMRTPLMYVDPRFDPVLLIFPKGYRREDLKAVNERLRHFYEYHPLVGNIIDLHAEFPLSDFELQCEDSKIQQFYNDFKERTGLLSFMKMLMTDYWLLGECFGYGNWDDSQKEWESFNQYPPEAIEVKQTYVLPEMALYYLYPDTDQGLSDIMSSSDPADQKIVEFMQLKYPGFVQSVKEKKGFLLDSSRVIHFARKPTKYAPRGVSIVKRAVSDLLLEVKLRLLEFTFADRHMYPIKLWKLGSETLGWIPSNKHLEKFQSLLAQATNDPDFNIIYHFGVTPDFVGTKDKIANLDPYFEKIWKRVMVALFSSENLVHGETSSYASGAVSLKLLMNRYMIIRAELEKIIKRKIFLPLAVKRGFKRADGTWILPDYIWQKVNLMSNTSMQQFVMSLREKKDIPFGLVCDIFGWDKRILEKQLKEEEGTIFDPDFKRARDTMLSKPEVQLDILKGKKLEDIMKILEKLEEKEEPVKEKAPEEKQPELFKPEEIVPPKMQEPEVPPPSLEEKKPEPGEEIPGEEKRLEELPKPLGLEKK